MPDLYHFPVGSRPFTAALSTSLGYCYFWSCVWTNSAVRETYTPRLFYIATILPLIYRPLLSLLLGLRMRKSRASFYLLARKRNLTSRTHHKVHGSPYEPEHLIPLMGSSDLRAIHIAPLPSLHGITFAVV